MDAAEQTGTKGGEGGHQLSINIHAPCNNRIYGGDHIEVNIHMYPAAKRENSAEQASTAETDETAGTLDPRGEETVPA